MKYLRGTGVVVPMLFVLWFFVQNTTEKSAENLDGDNYHMKSPWSLISLVFNICLPIVGVLFVFRQKNVLDRVIRQLDQNCLTAFLGSTSKREKLLKWASSHLPASWSSKINRPLSGLEELWKNGSLLCTVVNSVVPGACLNPHRHWRKPPVHAQAIAYKYFGVVPAFTMADFSKLFNDHLENAFLMYLWQLQSAVDRRPKFGNSTTTKSVTAHIMNQYVIRGMGLYNGEEHRKAIFYVYLVSVSPSKWDTILLYIRGPYGSFGKAVITPVRLADLSNYNAAMSVLESQLKCTKVLPFRRHFSNSFISTICSSINGSGDNSEQNKDIPIQVDLATDRAKVTYIPRNKGMHEISLVCNGELLKNCPFHVRITRNISGKFDGFTFDQNNNNSNTITDKQSGTKTKPITNHTNSVICNKSGKRTPDKVQFHVSKPHNLSFKEDNAKNLITFKELRNKEGTVNNFPTNPSGNESANGQEFDKCDRNHSQVNCNRSIARISPICGQQISDEVSGNEEIVGISSPTCPEQVLDEDLNSDTSLHLINPNATEPSDIIHSNLIDYLDGSSYRKAHMRHYGMLVQSKKEYWERMLYSLSARNCASYTNLSSIKDNMLIANHMRNNILWHQSGPETIRSTEDLYSFDQNMCSSLNCHKSMDHGLEKCVILSIKDRKTNLIRNQNKIKRGKSESSPVDAKDTVNRTKQYHFLSEVSNQIHRFNSEEKPSGTKQSQIPIREVIDEKKLPASKQLLKHQFKRTIGYFKNLEEGRGTSKQAKSRRFFYKRYSLTGSEEQISNILHKDTNLTKSNRALNTNYKL